MQYSWQQPSSSALKRVTELCISNVVSGTAAWENDTNSAKKTKIVALVEFMTFRKTIEIETMVVRFGKMFTWFGGVCNSVFTGQILGLLTCSGEMTSAEDERGSIVVLLNQSAQCPFGCEHGSAYLSYSTARLRPISESLRRCSGRFQEQGPPRDYQSGCCACVSRSWHALVSRSPKRGEQ